uniref:Inositol 1,4,5-trisphosphate receptor n=1 Tax=Trypanosoma congolense (strain IL3000) TaxID=1068625 RepID=G0URN5_TRYCI|nr:conserved hypothetical protein [Trypanosoma congolense IL3000]
MSQNRTPLRYGSFVHLSCDNGYITANGLCNEDLFIRTRDDLNDDAEPLPLLAFETSVFQIVPAAITQQKPAETGGGKGIEPLPGCIDNVHAAPEVTFGGVFMLVHAVSRLQVVALPSEPSENDPNCARLVLAPLGEIERNFCQFTFTPRYMTHTEGDIVCRGYEVLIRLCSLPIFFQVTSVPTNFARVENAESLDLAGQATDACDRGGRGPASVGSASDAARGVLEVNMSEAKALIFVVECYDADRDRAEHQRALHHISRPCIPAGVPIIFYHLEHKRVLATSAAMPPHEPKELRSLSNTADEDTLTKAEHGHVLKTREVYTMAGDITITRCASQVGDCKASCRQSEDHISTETSLEGGGDPITTGGRRPFRGGTVDNVGDTTIPLLVEDDSTASKTFSESGSLTGVSCSCTALWILEYEQPTMGGPVHLRGGAYRLRQACSNLYLAVTGSAVDDILDEGGSSDGSGALQEQHDDIAGIIGNDKVSEEVRATTLCMIPPPRTPKDLHRTLFTVNSMFSSDFGYLTDNECFLLQNVTTRMYVCTEEKGGKLILAWKPSKFDLMVARRADADVQDNALLLWLRCEALRKYRDAFQELARKKASARKLQELEGERPRGTQPQTEGHSSSLFPRKEVAIPPSFDHIPESFVRPQRVYSKSDDMDNAYAALSPIIYDCQRTIAELIIFCSTSPDRDVLRRDGIPIPRHQHMLVELGVHHLIIDVIIAPFTTLGMSAGAVTALSSGICEVQGIEYAWKHLRDDMQRDQNIPLPLLPLSRGVVNSNDILLKQHREVHIVCRLAFRLLRQMACEAPGFKAGFDRYIPYFLALDGRRLVIVDSLTRILSNNPDASISCVEQVMDHCIANLRRARSGEYLKVMCSLCSVESNGVVERQELVCRKLLMENTGLLCHFVEDANGEWAITTGEDEQPLPYKTFFGLQRNEHGEDTVANTLVEYVQNELELLGTLCLRGCPALCIEEVSKVFPPGVLLQAVRTFAWTGGEVAGHSDRCDIMRSHLIRLAMHCCILPCIDDPAVQLRGSAVLLGSSGLHIKVNNEMPLSGRADDQFIHTVKAVTLRIVQANPYFVQSDTCRNVLLQTALNTWLQFVTAQQISAKETTCLVPLLLTLLDGSKDELHDSNSRIAEYTWTRIEISEAALHVIRARVMVCQILLKMLESVTNRAANEINLILHNVLARDHGVGAAHYQKHDNGSSLQVFASTPTEQLFAPPPTERDALLAETSKGDIVNCAGCFDCFKHGHARNYHSTDPSDETVIQRTHHTGDPSALADYLRYVCGCIVRLFRVEELVPRLIDIARCDRLHLTSHAMELLVRICTVKRSVARRVLQVHTLPSSEVVQCFDHIYSISAQVRMLYLRGCTEESIELALRGIEGSEVPAEASSETTGEVAGDISTDEYDGDLAVYDDDEEFDGCDVQEKVETALSPTITEKEGHQGESKPQKLWSKAATAARIVVYRNAIIARRRSVGLSETSRVPLRVVVRADTVRHWQIHITMLGMYPSISRSSPVFTKWMRFFYIFTLSRSNAQALRPHIGVFLDALTANSSCVVMSLHTILSILATISDPTPYLTDTFLRRSAEYIDGEIAAPHPDSEFAVKLGLTVFAKPTVGGVPRRRMLQLLRDCNAFRCLPTPGVLEKHGRGQFTACIVEMICRICGTSMGAVALGCTVLPMPYLLEVITSYGTLYTPLIDVSRRRALWESNAFHLLSAYLLALVTLYIAAGNAEGGGARNQRQMDWMAHRGWWAVVLLLSQQLKELTHLMRSQTEAVVWRGFRILQRYRNLWLVNIPLALLTFMTECFSEAGFYRCREGMGAIFQKMCTSVAEFSEVLLARADAVRLQSREMVGYRRLVALLQVKTRHLVGHELLASAMLAARHRLRHGVVHYHEKVNSSEQRIHGLLHTDLQCTTSVAESDEDDEIQDSLATAVDVSMDPLEDGSAPSSVGMHISGAATKCLEAERVREEFRALVRHDKLIAIRESMNLNEPAGIVNTLLQRSPMHSNIRDFISKILSGVRDCSFSPTTLVGLLNIFYNALRIALDEQERERTKHMSTKASSMIADIITVNSFDTDRTRENIGYLLQTVLSDIGMTRTVASLCAVDDPVVAYSAVRLTAALLEGGNVHAQEALLTYFRAHQERFFHNIQDMFHKEVDWVRRTNAAHQFVVLERGGVVPNVSNAHEFTVILLTNALTTPSPSRYTNSSVVSVGLGGAVGRKRLFAWDRAEGSIHLRLVCTLFRMLQLFCEGHNLDMQNYIRSQHDNLHSVNTVHEIVNLIAEVSAVVHPATVRMLQRGFDLLTELCQGPCHGNQEMLLSCGVCVVISKLLSCLNDSGDLRGGSLATAGPTEPCNDSDGKGSTSCDSVNETGNDSNGSQQVQGSCAVSKEDIGSLRAALTQCLLSIIEGCRSPDIFCKVLEQVPIEVIEREVTSVGAEVYDGMLEDEEMASDPSVEALFNWLIFLHTVKPYAEGHYRQQIEKMLEYTERLTSCLGFIEIQRCDGILERVLFRIPRIWRGLTKRIKKQLLAGINCNTRATKLADFMYHSDNVIFEVERAYAFQRWVEQRTRWPINKDVNRGNNKGHSIDVVPPRKAVVKNRLCLGQGTRTNMLKRFWNDFIAPVLFPTQLSFYEYSSILVAAIVNIILVYGEGSHWLSGKSQLWNNVLASLCVLQIVLSVIALVVDTAVFFPVSLYIYYRQKQKLFCGKAKFNESLQEVLRGLSAKEIGVIYLTRFSSQFRIFLVIMSVLSVIVSRYFAAAHLTLMIYTFPTLRTFVTAITHNGRQLMLTALLGIMGLYFFAIAGRIMFPGEFGSKDDGNGGAKGSKEGDDEGNCNTLLRCFTFIFWQGLRQGGGVGDVMEDVSWSSATLIPRLSYDLIFFALVNVVFLNIMFGIIIDTFGELRDSRRERENDLMSTCFICGLDADTLEKGQVGGFGAHVGQAHNMWMYLYFTHYLRHKNPDDFTGQESYVHEKIQRNDLSFFPDEDCVALQEFRDRHTQEGSNEADVEGALASSGVLDGAALRDSKVEPSGTAGNVKIVLKELTGVREAVGLLAREVAMEAERVKGLGQQLQLLNRGSRDLPGRGGALGGSNVSIADTYESRGARSRHHEPKNSSSSVVE